MPVTDWADRIISIMDDYDLVNIDFYIDIYGFIYFIKLN